MLFSSYFDPAAEMPGFQHVTPPQEIGPYSDYSFGGEDMVVPRFHREFARPISLKELLAYVNTSGGNGQLSQWRVNHFTNCSDQFGNRLWDVYVTRRLVLGWPLRCDWHVHIITNAAAQVN